jgi:hypothetical protein
MGGQLTEKMAGPSAAGTDPFSVGLSPDGGSAYAPNNGSDDVSQYDVGSAGVLNAKSDPTVAAGIDPVAIATVIPTATSPGPPETPGPTPSPNQFTVTNAKKAKAGTRRLTIAVEAPGMLQLRGPGVRKLTRQVAGPGQVLVAIKAGGSARRTFARLGSAKLKVSITFTPTGGTANTTIQSVTLVKRR